EAPSQTAPRAAGHGVADGAQAGAGRSAARRDRLAGLRDAHAGGVRGAAAARGGAVRLYLPADDEVRGAWSAIGTPAARSLLSPPTKSASSSLRKSRPRS